MKKILLLIMLFSSSVTYAQFWQGFLQGTLMGTQQLIRQQQIRQQQELERQRQEEERKRQAEERQRREEERKRQEEERKKREETYSTSENISSDNQEIRYKGIYTISSQGRSQSSGGYTGVAGPDFEIEITIYDDYIIVGGTKCKFSRISSGNRVYSDSGVTYGNFTNQDSYYVDSNYNIRKVSTFSSPLGTDWFEYDVSKGRCTMPKQQPTYGNSTSYGNISEGSYSNSQQSNISSAGSSSCSLCHGKGTIIRESSVSLYGTENSKVYCNICEKYFWRSTGHNHITCPQCHGR